LVLRKPTLEVPSAEG